MKLPVSVCMIVRDEEESLPRALASVAPHLAQIAVIDTGSRDRTVEIARSFGAEVAVRPWDDDFAAARNAALALAREPWILVLDADEELAAASLPALSRTLEEPDLGRLVHMHLLEREGGFEDVLLPRLFRNRPDIRYERAIHESVTESLWRLGETAPRPCEVVLLHHGYHGETVEARGKIARNLRIHRKLRAEGAADAYDLYKEAQILLRPEEAEERRTVLEDAWERVRAAPDAARREWPWTGKLRALFGQELLRSGEMARADEVLRPWPDELPAPELARARLDLCWRSGNPPLGIDASCLTDSDSLARWAALREDDAQLLRLAASGCAEAAAWAALRRLEERREAQALELLAPFLAASAVAPAVRLAAGIVLARRGEGKAAADLLGAVGGDLEPLAMAWRLALRRRDGVPPLALLEEAPEPRHHLEAGLALALAREADVRVEPDPGFRREALERAQAEWLAFLAASALQEEVDRDREIHLRSRQAQP